jgi:predicted DCC family thiol-disulfide oxidoreductase YuxK
MAEGHSSRVERTVAARGSPAEERPVILYDGGCGLCHAFVRLVAAHDRRARFRFAPLEGEWSRAELDPSVRDRLPDSVVLRAAADTLLVRSDAVLAVLRELGGVWAALARAAALVPRPLRDGLYDALARARRRLAGTPTESCPLLPPGLRDRFLL